MMPAVPSKPSKSQAPIFQRRPDLAEKFDQPRKAAAVSPSADLPAQEFKLPLVTPLAVFAAGRPSFDCVVRGDFSKQDALAVIFSLLPMEEQGWVFDATDIVPSGTRAGWPLWRVSRVTA